MPLICYEPKKFSAERLKLIGVASQIMEEYAAKGYGLTLRQLYYQFVSKAIIPNKVEEYNRLGDLVSDARLAGLLDWHHLEDRTREVYGNQHWEKPSDVIRSAMKSYETDKWANQNNYVEVWVEKDALSGVLANVCPALDVRYFACIGYTSQSAMWNAAQRLIAQIQKGKTVHIIHLGDHDPSGIDMSRDIKARLSLFTYGQVHVQRVALNMLQIERFNPPPNPAKMTDSRFASYQERFGDSSWELDALNPETIEDIIRRAVLQFRDENKWNEALELEARGRKTLSSIIEHFPDVVALLRGKQAKAAVLCAECGATADEPWCSCVGRSLLENKEIE